MDKGRQGRTLRVAQAGMQGREERSPRIEGWDTGTTRKQANVRIQVTGHFPDWAWVAGEGF